MPDAPTTHEPRTLLSASGVRVALGGNEILHGVDIAVRGGEAVAVMGANGSGKSTLIRALVGVLPMTAGTVTFGDHPNSAHARARLGYVPQRISAAGGVAATSLEVVTAGLLGAGRLRPPRDARRRALAALEELGVADLASRDVGSLSGGQQQRVLIARAMVREPDLLVLDEPMTGVDLQSQVALVHTLDHLKAHGAGIVVVLHEIGPLATLIDTAVVLDHGTVSFTGPPPQDLGIHALPGHEHTHAHEDPRPPASGPVLEVQP
ncbi:metal ABC transporter ATP-binding protein [Demequina sp.]|uniref:metal ABC transporter ATP-binding protein n=1 Tax=Demequina sp. TaxID=2050685 RepID=UPI003D0DD3BC